MLGAQSRATHRVMDVRVAGNLDRVYKLVGIKSMALLQMAPTDNIRRVGFFTVCIIGLLPNILEAVLKDPKIHFPTLINENEVFILPIRLVVKGMIAKLLFLKFFHLSHSCLYPAH